MKTLIEVGSYDGTDSLKFHSQGFRVFTFEPAKHLVEHLINKTRHLENYTIIPKAVCLTNGKTQFNICKYGGASSILPFRSDNELKKHWNNREDIYYSGISYDVDTIRLDTFIESYNLEDTKIDYIHIDAQGVDLDVLKSLGKYINNIQAGVLETIITDEKSIYIGQSENTMQNTLSFLTLNGFTITKVESNDAEGCEYNIYFNR